MQKYLTTEKIIEFLFKYLPEAGEKTLGLFVLPTQTGSGKTHATSQFMVHRGKRGGKSVYIVNTRANLIDTYRKTMDYAQNSNLKILLLESAGRHVVKYFKENKKAPEKIGGLEEFHQLRRAIQIVLTAAKKEDDSEFVDKVAGSEIKKLKRAASGVHRHHFSKIKELSGSQKKAKDKKTIEKIEEEIAFHTSEIEKLEAELSKIFPEVGIDEYDIVFMTTSKFLYTLYHPNRSKKLYEREAFYGALLFIDEFDSQKNIILGKMIEDANKNMVDKISLFVQIASMMSSKQFMKKFKIKKETIEDLSRDIEEVYRRYNMHFSFRRESDDASDETILRDISSLKVIGSGAKKMDIKTDEEKQSNIVFDGNRNTFMKMMKDINDMLNRVVGIGKIIVNLLDPEEEEIYEKRRNPRAGSDEIHRTSSEMRSDAIRNFVREIEMESNDSRYLYLQEAIRKRIEAGETGKYFRASEKEFYESGITILNISHRPGDTKSDFNSIAMMGTPESTLAQWCGSMFVVGISATATVPTITRNFHLEYLKSTVDCTTLDHDEIEMMNRLYIETKKQEKRKIHIKGISAPKSAGIDNKNKAYRIAEKLYGSMSLREQENLLRMANSYEEFRFDQYVRILSAYREFAINGEIQSFLCLLPNKVTNRSALKKIQNSAGKSMVLHEMELARLMFHMLEANEENLCETVKDSFREISAKRKEFGQNETAFFDYLLDNHLLFFHYDSSEEAKNAYKEIANRLFENKKMFVISNYVAMGAGRNIHYRRKKSDGTSEEKDFDALYLDLPTALLPRQYGEGEKRVGTMLKLAYYLYALKEKGEYGYSEYIRYMKMVFSGAGGALAGINYKDTEDYKQAIAAIVVQAIGRLYRTDTIRPMYIFYDEAMSEALANFDPTGQSMLPAVKELLKHIMEKQLDPEGMAQSKKHKEEQRLKNKLLNKTQHMKNEIFYWLAGMRSAENSNRRERAIKEWQAIRRTLLRYPTKAKMTREARILYSDIPAGATRYWYRQTGDFEKLEVSFVKQHGFSEVSEEAAKLDLIAKIPELKPCIEQNKIALRFEHSNMMIPIAFNNLYKGALGEVIGKYLLETYAHIGLQELDISKGDIYEQFDYVSSDGRCYFDFKYFSYATLRSTGRDEVIKKASEKLEGSRASKVFIINIFAELDTIPDVDRSIHDREVVIVPFLISVKNDTPVIEYETLKKIGGMASWS